MDTLGAMRETAPPSPNHPWDEEEIRRFRAALLEFFQSRKRDLPWRGTSDPYRILVSEVMLQQTRVETVIPYYRKWMERFPDAAALAEAEVEEVLGTWQGLGYYGRARNLHRAVREIVARYDGRVPDSREALGELPGIGPYTSGAVASIAFGLAAPAVDGNVRRVLARVMDAAAPTASELERWAGGLVDPDRPGDFNQALMELGSLVCTPRGPACPGCPVRAHCRAREAGTVEERPLPRARRKAPRVDEAVAVLMDTDNPGGPVLLRRRPADGLLGGMWELPGVEVVRGEGGPRKAAEALARELLAYSGASAWTRSPRAMRPVAHAFSHRRMRYHPFLFRVGKEGGDKERGENGSGGHANEAADPADGAALRWVDREARVALPLPAAQRRILEAIKDLSDP